MLQNWVGLAVGAVVGAMLRFFITNRVNKRWNHSFPLATFLINFVGSFLLGSLYQLDRGVVDQTLWLYMIGIGFLGSFTTFSTFTYETAILLDRRAVLTSMSYLTVSLIMGLFGAWLATIIM